MSLNDCQDAYNRLVAFAARTRVRDDWHEPDEQDVSAEIIGGHLDNAMGNEVVADLVESGSQEYLVRLVQHGEGEKAAHELTINLATLLAIAARPGWRTSSTDPIHQAHVDAFNHGHVDAERFPLAGKIAEARDLLGAKSNETLLDVARRVKTVLFALDGVTVGEQSDIAREIMHVRATLGTKPGESLLEGALRAGNVLRRLDAMGWDVLDGAPDGAPAKRRVQQDASGQLHAQEPPEYVRLRGAFITGERVTIALQNVIGVEVDRKRVVIDSVVTDDPAPCDHVISMDDGDRGHYDLMVTRESALFVERLLGAAVAPDAE